VVPRSAAMAPEDALPTLYWMREAELKHGRLCMLAIVGFAGVDNGLHWPGTGNTKQSDSEYSRCIYLSCFGYFWLKKSLEYQMLFLCIICFHISLEELLCALFFSAPPANTNNFLFVCFFCTAAASSVSAATAHDWGVANGQMGVLLLAASVLELLTMPALNQAAKGSGREAGDFALDPLKW